MQTYEKVSDLPIEARMEFADVLYQTLVSAIGIDSSERILDSEIGNIIEAHVSLRDDLNEVAGRHNISSYVVENYIIFYLEILLDKNDGILTHIERGKDRSISTNHLLAAFSDAAHDGNRKIDSEEEIFDRADEIEESNKSTQITLDIPAANANDNIVVFIGPDGQQSFFATEIDKPITNELVAEYLEKSKICRIHHCIKEVGPVNILDYLPKRLFGELTKFVFHRVIKEHEAKVKEQREKQIKAEQEAKDKEEARVRRQEKAKRKAAAKERNKRTQQFREQQKSKDKKG